MAHSIDEYEQLRTRIGKLEAELARAEAVTIGQNDLTELRQLEGRDDHRRATTQAEGLNEEVEALRGKLSSASDRLQSAEQQCRGRDPGQGARPTGKSSPSQGRSGRQGRQRQGAAETVDSLKEAATTKMPRSLPSRSSWNRSTASCRRCRKPAPPCRNGSSDAGTIDDLRDEIQAQDEKPPAAVRNCRPCRPNASS